jgi:hypothetical protein
MCDRVTGEIDLGFPFSPVRGSSQVKVMLSSLSRGKVKTFRMAVVKAM